MIAFAVPPAQIGALDLIERQRRQRPVASRLDQRPRTPRRVRFGPDPLRARALGRPKHHHRPGRAEALFDDVAIIAVRRKLVVAPHAVAPPAQRIGDGRGLRLGRSRIGNENIRHPGPFPSGYQDSNQLS